MNRGKHYTASFYAGEGSGWSTPTESAEVILAYLLSKVQIRSVIDIGCGAGYWPAVAAKLGLDILGVDGEWATKVDLQIPLEHFLSHDLTTPLKPPRRFDLAISLEVAEHIEPQFADLFVRSICSSSDLVLFSAAIPEQGGRLHVNEQWPKYWAQKFLNHGYRCYDVLRSRFWDDQKVRWYYAQNCLIFAKNEIREFGIPGMPLSLVHPKAWMDRSMPFGSPVELLLHLPSAISRRVNRFKI